MNASTQNEMERLVRVNREQQTLLDQIYQYVDEQGLAKLGQSRVKALIEAHKRAEKERKMSNYKLMQMEPTTEMVEAAEQKPATDVAGPTKVRYIDGLGAVRNSPADCREGVSYVTVADTVYWPLRADDAQRLLSAEFGRGDFTGPGTSTDVSALVKALERIASMDSMPYHSLDSAKITARAALAAHRKQGVRHEP